MNCFHYVGDYLAADQTCISDIKVFIAIPTYKS